jgi:hypothetical protein
MNKISDEELAVIRKYAKALGLKEIKSKKSSVKKERTPQQIAADKERMAKLRAM